MGDYRPERGVPVEPQASETPTLDDNSRRVLRWMQPEDLVAYARAFEVDAKPTNYMFCAHELILIVEELARRLRDMTEAAGAV